MRLLFLILFLYFNTQFFSQNKIHTGILKNLKSQEKAWNSGNIDEFMKYYWNNDSLMFIGSKGVTYGWTNTLNNYKKTYPNKEAMGILNFTIIKIEKFSKSCTQVIGKWQLTKEKPIGGHFTLIWKKIKGSWVIVSDHTS